jgi:assimilatory nitrate reductase catalytic subunit
MTNSERRITRVHAAVPAPGEARADWEIAADFARRLGARQGKRTTGWMFPYASVEDVFNEHRETTRGRDLDITGLSYALLEAEGPQQWPFPEGAARGRARLYTDGVFATADGRARFAPTVYRPVAEPPDRDYPLQLTTGRLRDQWHSMTRTGSAARLFNHAPEPVAAMNAADLAERGIRDGDIVRVASRRGAVALRVQASPDVAAGQVFVPMHWGSRHLNSAGANALTHGAFDPVSRQPELKHAAVAVERLILPWQMVVMKRRDPLREGASALAIMQDAQHLLARFDYASIGLCGREEAVVVLRVSNAAAPARELVEEIDQVFGLNDVSRIIAYFDVKRGISKRVLLDGGIIIGARLAGETAAYEWLRDVMVGEGEAPRPWLLAPLAALPDRQTQRGRVVCNCFDVAESEIRVVLDSGADLAALQGALRCGTECGSCVPELKRMCAGVPGGSRSAGARGDPG